MSDTPKTIADDVVVTIEYTLRNEGGEVLDESHGDDALSYLHGHDNIVAGLESALTGKQVGDVVTIAVAPEDGYGVRDPAAVRSLAREEFPPDADLRVGVQFVAELEDGEQVPMWITAVDDDNVSIDLNHPLAGVTLHFEVKVLELRQAGANELAHGHPHGRDGHDHHHH